MAHAITAHLGACDFNTTLLADDSLEAHALVLAAVALPVTGWSENLFAEQTVALGAQCAVVDGFRLLNFACRP